MKKHICSLASFFFSIPLLLSASEPLNISINSFASKFYEEALASSSNNEVFSPYCLFNCLSMVYLGADGSTKKEMEQVLCLGLLQEDLPVLLKNLSESLRPKDDLLQLNIGNSLWAGQNTFLLPSYKQAIQQELQAKVDLLDFSNASHSAKRINAWIEEETNGLLHNVLDPQDISPRTQLMLVSALYFKGAWQKPFLAENTKEKLFYKEDSSSYPVPMMNQVGSLPYFENGDMQLLLLPFSEEMACFFVLPKHSLQDLEDLQIFDWISSAKPIQIDVSLPRFKIQPKYDLVPMLCNLGMPSAFSSFANFSKMNGEFDLCIDKAQHVAFFSLNEQGVTAAAMTSISMICKCVHIKETPAVSFTANRPFLFGVVDLKSNVMLFLGKMIEP